MNEPTVNSARFEAITQISPGRLKKWSEKGILRPRIQEHQRRFTERDVYGARLMMNLSARHFTHHEALPIVHQVIDDVMDSTTPAEDLMVIVLKLARRRRPYRAIVVPRPEALAEIRKHPAPGFLIDFRDIVESVRGCGRYFRPKSISR